MGPVLLLMVGILHGHVYTYKHIYAHLYTCIYCYATIIPRVTADKVM